MRRDGTRLVLAATDLANFLACKHLTALDMAAARGKLKRPYFHDPLRELLAQRGREHEQAYVNALASQGKRVGEVRDDDDDEPAEGGNHDGLSPHDRTVRLMQSGVDTIVQGALTDGSWFGRTDILQRVEKPSMFGPWSYEVADTKLSQDTRAGTILQLSLYSELLEKAQGARPEHFHVITPAPGGGAPAVHSFRLDDFAAYYRLVRDKLVATAQLDDQAVADANYPEPVEHCSVCVWGGTCRDKRHRDDHLSLVYGMSRAHRQELEPRGVATLASFATWNPPADFKPKRGDADSCWRSREQARVQFASRGLPVPVHELRDLVDAEGLMRLPDPSPGDVFLDLEGDPFAAEGGREYLFGAVRMEEDSTPEYRAFWGMTAAEEKKAFEDVMDLIEDAVKQYPGMHIYHYAAYEPSAFKRLMGRHVTREDALDRLLRAGRFVDLYAVVRQALRVGVEKYSIKSLEPLYGFPRKVELVDARVALRQMEHALELNAVDSVPQEVRTAVQGYNEDDCVSTLRLRDWLETVRSKAIASGMNIPRPVTPEPKATEALSERAARVAELRARLLAGVPEERTQCNDEQQAKWLLACLLDWHRREDKATWWEYFRLRDLPDEDLADEPQALTGLQFRERVAINLSKKGKPTGPVTDRYNYPPQEMEIQPGAELKLKDEKFGDVVAVNREARTIDVNKGKKHADNHPVSLFAHKYIETKMLEAALLDVGDAVAADGMTTNAGAPDRAARDLLLRNPPRLTSGAFSGDAVSIPFLERVVQELDETTLAIQGPPGSGKTYSGARMICALVAAGKRVGVTANSHQVILKLLEGVAREGDRLGTSARLGRVTRKAEDEQSSVVIFDEADHALTELAAGAIHVLGGTAWVWSADAAQGALDVLFVDEAAQMSLANVIAISRAAKSLVLLGDPRQLGQPQKGSHPEGVNNSALQHLLGDAQTIAPDKGVFLAETWRLAPAISSFTSELFYEGKLRSCEGLDRQVLKGTRGFEGAGLFYVDVEHDGNRSSSTEELECVAQIVEGLMQTGACWVDRDGVEQPLRGEDILVVSPYNAQVSRLDDRLSRLGVRVGTVDRFQGQEAPVVIYSMATSRPEDAPRGMEFLYSPNRLNVATSRAQCAAIIVASPRLFEPECKTPRQMVLANGLCRYREIGVGTH